MILKGQSELLPGLEAGQHQIQAEDELSIHIAVRERARDLNPDVPASRVGGGRRSYAHEEGKTIVLTTHQLALAQELCDRITIIHQGHLLTDLPVRELLARFHKETYEIRLGGPLDSSASSWLGGFSITFEDGESRIRGPISDQEKLYYLLTRIRAQHLPLIAVEPVEPNWRGSLSRSWGGIK